MRVEVRSKFGSLGKIRMKELDTRTAAFILFLPNVVVDENDVEKKRSVRIKRGRRRRPAG